jgi:hypothetical protein
VVTLSPNEHFAGFSDITTLHRSSARVIVGGVNFDSKVVQSVGCTAVISGMIAMSREGSLLYKRDGTIIVLRIPTTHSTT